MPTLLLFELSGRIVRAGREKGGKAADIRFPLLAEETLIVSWMKFRIREFIFIAKNLSSYYKLKSVIIFDFEF